MSRFKAIVRDAVEGLPASIREHLDNVVIDVEDEPTVEFLREAGFTEEEIEAGEMPLGYFIPFDGIDAGDLLDNPDRIVIFKRPHEEDFPDPAELVHEIRKTVIHEIGHHFGWDERDMEAYGLD